MAEPAASAAAGKWLLLCAPRLRERPGCGWIESTWMEAVMPTEWTKLVIGMVAAILMAAICTSTIGSAFAQARLGQIGRDSLTNRYEPPHSETEVQLRLDM
jgi:hypothetical protein